MTDSLDDPFIHDLMDKFSHLGYVVWFGLIEIIAKESKNKPTGKIEVSPTYLRRKLRTSPTKLREVLDFCQTNLRLSVNYSKKNWEINFPKIAEIKDNYTKDLQASCKKLAPYIEEEVEVEKEIEIEKEKEVEEKESVGADVSAPCTTGKGPGEAVGQSEESGGSEKAETQKRKKPANEAKKPKRKTGPNMPEDEWIAMLQANPAYQGIDISKLKAKMEVWCELNGRQPTRKRLLNWLNREEKPLQTQPKQGDPHGTSRHTGLDKKDYTAGLDEFYGRKPSVQ